MFVLFFCLLGTVSFLAISFWIDDLTLSVVIGKSDLEVIPKELGSSPLPFSPIFLNPT